MDPATGNTNDKTAHKTQDDWTPPPPDWSQAPISQEPPHPTQSFSPSSSAVPMTTAPFSTVPVPEVPVVPPAPVTPPVQPVVPAPIPQPSVSAALSMDMPPAPVAEPFSAVPSMEPSTTASLVPGVVPVIPPPSAQLQGASKKGGGKKALILLILVFMIFAALGGAGYFYLNMQKSTPVAEKDTTTATSSASKASSFTGTLLYGKNQNIYSYDLKTNKETALTEDGSTTRVYSQPQWVGEDSFSLVRCGDKSEDGKAAYTCTLLLKPVSREAPVEIASVSSQPNVNGVHAGDITTYAWDSKKTKLAYLTSERVDTRTVFKLFYKEHASASAELLKELSQTGGRGGSLDDGAYLEFSPEGEKLLLTLTSIYPVTEGTDEGTLFVFDLPSKQQVWHMEKTWGSFGHFLSGHIFSAKQTPVSTESGVVSQLSWIDLIKSSTNPEEGVTKITDAPNWYGLLPLTKDLLTFYSVATESGKGVTLEEVNLTTKTKKLLKDQLLPVKVLSQDQVLVWTMKKCPEGTEGCVIDVYNGYMPEGLGIFDKKTSTVKNLTIASVSAVIGEVDVRKN